MARLKSERAWINANLGKLRLCPRCGVPEEITKNHLWLNSGVIVQSANISRRICFIDCEYLDPIYRSVGDIIGFSIENHVMDIVRLGTVDYFKNLVQPEVREMLRDKVLGLNYITDFMVTMGHLNGNGRYELVEIRYEGDDDDFSIVRITEPFSLILAMGINCGASEVITGKPHEVTCKEISPGVYEIKSYVSGHTGESEERAPTKKYIQREGDIELPRCPECDGPEALSNFKWHLDRGLIVDSLTGRRMVMIGLEVQDPLFEDLERELGDTVPRAVVEAHRLLVKQGSYSGNEIMEEGELRTQLALRGIGNLRDLTMSAKGLHLRMDNPSSRFMTAGILQGLFEKAFDVESNVGWETSEEGDLEVEVIPK
jgi:hypothetical protein